MPKLPDHLRNTDSRETNGNGTTTHPVVVGNGQDKPVTGDRLSINLYDLDRIPPDMRCMMGLAYLVHTGWVVRVDKDRPDEVGVAFTCDLLAAACLCDTIRSWDNKAGDYPTRVYICKGRVWERLPGKAILSLVDEDGTVRLNPKWFAIQVLPGDLIPPPFEDNGSV